MTAVTRHPFRALVTAVALAMVGTVVVVLGGGAAPSQATDYHPEWGSFSAPDGVLQKGCHTYPYSYSFTPPDSQWAVEVFVTDPNGAAVNSNALLEGGNPLSGELEFKLCSSVTVPGTFTINAKLSVRQADDPAHQEGFLPPETFVLSKQVKHKQRPVLGLGPIRVRR